MDEYTEGLFVTCEACANYEDCSSKRTSDPHISQKMWVHAFWRNADACYMFKERSEAVEDKQCQ